MPKSTSQSRAAPIGTAFASAPCRFCGNQLITTFVDLGSSPLCETYLAAHELNAMERFYPLHVYVCDACFLVQLEEYVSPNDIFTHYAYFSSYSTSWLAHAERFTNMATERFSLGPQSLVIELASNDGYLLQYFVKAGIPVLGIDPAKNVAAAAVEKGVNTITRFFGRELGQELAESGQKADLIIGNNVLAQVPNLNDFVGGLPLVLADHGVLTMEFPHLERLIEGNQFDTIYHEHFSYFSLLTVKKIFTRAGLTIFDVEELPTHGGSLRIYARHEQDTSKSVTDRLRGLLAHERKLGMEGRDYYLTFAQKVMATKRKLLRFLIDAKESGKTVAGYGAPGKGNTLLNYCGIRSDLLEYTVDRNPFKHGKFLPGTHIPIYDPSRIEETKPDYLLILPWNLKDEIVEQLAYIRDWGGRWVIPIPGVEVIE